ncbi:uncharacterized protein BXZ73DRAFT_102288 [Epithele typhae]|uniref:uncharacterized protein n=1 Tax=Epithele typhae TaxID=378194 RepID=UPI0020087D20|nr:uncharacterized protein BXZ73DRAFT_102288 [Epithele typhae]KAH9928446.1 hypothetical protein BXZ73DRAFT_102288 [Epithele typhae]
MEQAEFLQQYGFVKFKVEITDDLTVHETIRAAAEEAGMDYTEVCMAVADYKLARFGWSAPAWQVIFAKNKMKFDGTRRVVDLTPCIGELAIFTRLLNLKSEPEWMLGVLREPGH